MLFSLACLFICFSGISLAFLFVLLVCYYLLFFLFVWYFNIIARSDLLLLFFSRACFCFLVVMYAIVSAPCSVNAERGNVRAGREERRNGGKGNAWRTCPALPDCRCYRCIIYHYARTYAAGVYRPAPGGTFSVRFAGKKQPNRSCSSPQPIVHKAIYTLPR